MKYLIVGAGGVGGPLGALMRLGGMDHVEIIARGEQLEAMRDGYTLVRNGAEEDFVTGVKVSSQEEYLASGEHPDILFVCVKTYSVADVAPFVQEAAGPETVIIPLMNGIRTGDLLRRYVKNRQIAEGCVYVYSRKDGPGRFRLDSRYLRVLFGAGETAVDGRILAQAEKEMRAAGVDATYAENIAQETLRKFSYVSPAGAVGLRYGCCAEGFQKEGPARELFKEAVQNVIDLGKAMGVELPADMLTLDLALHDSVPPESTTSMQRDVAAGGRSEYDNQVLEPIRLGERYGVDMTAYRKVASFAIQQQ